jgi:hypothetical protein
VLATSKSSPCFLLRNNITRAPTTKDEKIRLQLGLVGHLGECVRPWTERHPWLCCSKFLQELVRLTIGFNFQGIRGLPDGWTDNQPHNISVLKKHDILGTLDEVVEMFRVGNALELLDDNFRGLRSHEGIKKSFLANGVLDLKDVVWDQFIYTTFDVPLEIFISELGEAPDGVLGDIGGGCIHSSGHELHITAEHEEFDDTWGEIAQCGAFDSSLPCQVSNDGRSFAERPIVGVDIDMRSDVVEQLMAGNKGKLTSGMAGWVGDTPTLDDLSVAEN